MHGSNSICTTKQYYWNLHSKIRNKIIELVPPKLPFYVILNIIILYFSMTSLKENLIAVNFHFSSQTNSSIENDHVDFHWLTQPCNHSKCSLKVTPIFVIYLLNKKAKQNIYIWLLLLWKQYSLINPLLLALLSKYSILKSTCIHEICVCINTYFEW